MKNSPGAKPLPCLQSSALSCAAPSAISICHNKPPLSQAGNYRFRSRTAAGSISRQELSSPDTRALPGEPSLAFIACGSRDSLGIHNAGDFICQLHSHIFTTWITDLHCSQAALCALQRLGINIWLCVQQKGAQMVWGVTGKCLLNSKWEHCWTVKICPVVCGSQVWGWTIKGQLPPPQSPSQFSCSLNPLQAELSVHDRPVTHKREGSTKLQADFKWALIEVTRRELSIVRVSYNSNKQSSLKNDVCIPLQHSTHQVSAENIKVSPHPTHN